MGCNISCSFSEDVACTNETLELYYKPLNMPILCVFAGLYYFFFVYDSRLVPLSPVICTCEEIVYVSIRPFNRRMLVKIGN